MLVKIAPYLVAMLIGLLIGVEREKQGVKMVQPMGVRSFLLIALLGAVAGGINQPLVAMSLALFAALAILMGYHKTTRQSNTEHGDVGLTTEIAAMATFALSYLANQEPLLSLALGVIALFFLHSKTLLHGFIREHLKPEEVQAAVVLLLLTVGVIPFIPDKTIDPWDIINLQKIAIVIALIASIQFASYVASRIFGQNIGLPLSGFLAGIISSTAAFISYSNLSKTQSTNYRAIGSAAVFSIAATLSELLVVLAVLSWRMLLALLIPVASIIAVCTIIGFLLTRSHAQEKSKSRQETENPLRLKSAIKLGLVLTTMIFLIQLTQKFLGETFVSAVTFLAGLFELHGVIIGSISTFEKGAVSLSFASSMTLLAILASMVSKVGIVSIFGSGPFRWVMLAILGILIGLSLAAWGYVTLFPDWLLQVS